MPGVFVCYVRKAIIKKEAEKVRHTYRERENQEIGENSEASTMCCTYEHLCITDRHSYIGIK